MNINIRPAVTSDLQVIKSFDEFGGDRSREIAAGTCLVAERTGRVVGYSSFEPQGLLGYPLLTFLLVCKEERRKGIATALVKAVQELAQGSKLVSSTEEWCVGSQKIFENLGWKRIGQIAELNKDGSDEIFYAINLDS